MDTLADTRQRMLEDLVAEVRKAHDQVVMMGRQLLADGRGAELQAYVDRLRAETGPDDPYGQELIQRLQDLVSH